VVSAGWVDVPHRDPETRDQMLAATPPHMRKADRPAKPAWALAQSIPLIPMCSRSTPFPIPPHWRRVYGLDVGWTCTAVVWGAIDDQTDTLYLYSEHYRGEVTVPVHASAIKARGAWIPGVSDPAANNQNQRDGIAPSSNIARKGWTFHWPTTRWRRAFKEVLARMESGRLRVFSTLFHWFAEHRLYSRDEKGAVIKKKDHSWTRADTWSCPVCAARSSVPRS
jgi:hypothetical protein